MITRLLIANRGEIAVRIAHTAHRMGIATVGIYSEPDANALHVDSVDVAVALGGSTPADSYLRGDAIIEAARAAGADAVHPGYGFLAENAAFAQRVIDAGLVWVGPTPDQIALLGDKVAAKRAAVEAGVPTAPVIDVAPGAIPSGVSMPALVKAAAGGGGRGMRIVRTAGELAGAVESATREAAAAFGDGSVFIEPYLEHGRHVEVQILGDAHGNVVHLGERECSIQRRNQKVIEEAPSAGINAEIRRTLCDGALALGRHVGYQNAGTVEFLVGPDGTVNFLEVNTRLQVEHPVTEAVTSLDLVELQLRVAAGERLPITQADVEIDGHAIEVRVVAEDPAAGWLPSTGAIEAFSVGDGVRVDAGIRAGAVVSPDYDSLLAKVIGHGPTRAEAAGRLARALRTTELTGVLTNLDCLVAILEDDDFLAADTPTSYLDTHPDLVAATGPTGDDLLALLLGAVFAVEQRDRAPDGPLRFAPSGWRNLRTQGQRQVWRTGDTLHHIEYVLTQPRNSRPQRPHAGAGANVSTADVWVGPWPEPQDDGSLGPDERRAARVRLLDRSDDMQVVEVDGCRHPVTVRLDDGGSATTAHARSSAGARTFVLEPTFIVHEADEAGSGPVSPLPGTVIAVHVEVGQTVSDGDVLVVVEAMKMEHTITAHGAATVAEIRFAVGERVDTGDLLVALEAHD